MINATDLIHFNKSGIRPEFHEMADEFCSTVIELTALLIRVERGEVAVRKSLDEAFNKLVDINDTVYHACHRTLHVFEHEGARIGEAARTLFLAQSRVTPQDEGSYSVYFANFMYYSEETFDTEEAAIAYAVDRGYDARIEKDDTPVASWSILGGLRRHPITPAQL